ncbi:MAG: endonuclease V [bacterium]
MNIPPVPHSWSVTPKQAIAIQKALASSIKQIKPKRKFRFVAGADLAFSRDGTRCIAGVILWDVKERTTVERHIATRRLTFPYVPGLLSFREAPAIISACDPVSSR